MVSKRNLLFQQWNFTFERFALGWPPFLNNCPEPFSKTGHNRRAPNRPNQPTFLLTVQDFKLCKKDHTFHICLANAVHKRQVNTSLQLFFQVPLFLRDLPNIFGHLKISQLQVELFLGFFLGEASQFSRSFKAIPNLHCLTILTLFLHPILANQLTIKGIHQHHLRPRSRQHPPTNPGTPKKTETIRTKTKYISWVWPLPRIPVASKGL